MSQTLDKYRITKGIKGYVSKPDPTDVDTRFNGRFLASGSQNMIINDQKRVESRSGYELFGAEATIIKPPKSEFTWKNSSEGEEFMREINGNLQWYSSISSAWETLLTGLSTTRPVRFTPVWDNTELIDLLLFVNNSSIQYNWSAAEGTYVSSTSTTITITEVIASARFLTNGTRKILVKDDSGVMQEFTVTGQAGSVFTVTEDPTAFSLTAGTVVVQSVRQNANTPAAGFTNDVIETFQNQVFVGSHTSQRVYVSSNSSFTDFTFSSPRIAGQGALITLDAAMVGFKTPGLRDTDTESKILAFAKNDRGYKITFEVSPGSTADREVPRVKPLPLAEGQGPISQELIGKVGQTVVWVTNDKELLELGQIESASFSDNVALSDPIKPDFLAADFTNGDLKFWKKNIVITAPPDGKTFIFDVSKAFWQTPQVLGMRKLSIYGGDLYGHSNSIDETYKLFTGLNDDGNPIAYKAHFVYRNANSRSSFKNFDRFFTELYIQANTKVMASILYEWKGSKGTTSYIIDGSKQEYLFTPVEDASLGVNSLGTNPLGGQLEAGEDTPKYRRFKTIKPTDHFEYQLRIEADDIDIAFQIMATGANIKKSSNLPTKLTK